MKTLTDDEQALLESLIDYWLDHADRRDASTHPQSAEYWKAQDFVRVALLRKLRGIAQIAGDFAESYQRASERAAAAESERDRARMGLLRVATALGIESDTQDEESVSASWSRLMEQIDSHFQTGNQKRNPMRRGESGHD